MRAKEPRAEVVQIPIAANFCGAVVDQMCDLVRLKGNAVVTKI